MAMEQSLFGPSVADIRSNLVSQDIKDFNNLTPTGLAGMAGGMIGRGLGGLAGMEDPRIAKAQALNEVKEELRKEGLDATKPDEFYPKLIRKLNEKGLTEEAMNVAASYQKQSLEGALKSSQIAEHIAKAGAAGREKLSTLGKLQAEYAEAVAKGDVTKANQLKEAIQLETQGKLEKITEGVAGKGDEWVRDVYKDGHGNVVITGEPYKKSPLVSIDQAGEKSDTLEQSKVAGKNYEDFTKSVGIASQMQPTLKNMMALLNNQKVITGGYKDFKEIMARFVGIPLGENPDSVADSQIFDALLQKVIIPQIRLFAPVSDYDIEALKKAYGDRKLEPQAIKRVIEIALQGVDTVLSTNKKLNKHLTSKGRLSDWDFGTGRSRLEPDEEPTTSSPTAAQPPTTPAPTNFDRQRLERLYPGKSPEWYADQQRKIQQRMAQ